MNLKEKIEKYPEVKKMILACMMHPVKTKPRWWLRQIQFLYMKKGKKSIIYRSVRKDIVPFNRFILGSYSVIEDFSTINNAVGDITIGDRTRIGLGNTIIGPVQIGNHVNLAQNVTVSGLNHNFQDVLITIDQQGVATLPVVIRDDVWIGANAVILPGVTIEEHSVVAAGSIVTRPVPAYSVCAGNPARIIKRYDFDKNDWIRISERS